MMAKDYWVKCGTNGGKELQRAERLPTAPARMAKGARIGLLAAEGHSNAQIARLVGMTEKTVRKWPHQRMETRRRPRRCPPKRSSTVDSVGDPLRGRQARLRST